MKTASWVEREAGAVIASWWQDELQYRCRERRHAGTRRRRVALAVRRRLGRRGRGRLRFEPSR
jgi:hypothetical protein